MKKIAKFLCFALVLSMLFSFVGCSSKSGLEAIQESGKIVMLTNAAFPPFEYTDGSTVVGVDADVAAEIAKDLGVELEIVDMDFDSLINALSSGKGDFVAAGMTVTEDRKKSVDFSIEYVTSSQYIIIPEGSTIATLADLAGKKVGVQLGTTGDLMMDAEINGSEDDDGNHIAGSLEGTGAELVQYKTGIEAGMDLANGRIDAVVIDKHPASAIAEKTGGLTVTENAISEEESYAIAVKKGNTDLVEAINETLQRLMDEGKIQEYLVNHTAG